MASLDTGRNCFPMQMMLVFRLYHQLLLPTSNCLRLLPLAPLPHCFHCPLGLEGRNLQSVWEFYLQVHSIIMVNCCAFGNMPFKITAIVTIIIVTDYAYSGNAFKYVESNPKKGK